MTKNTLPNLIIDINTWEILNEVKDCPDNPFTTYIKELNNIVYLPCESHFRHFCKKFPMTTIEEKMSIWCGLPSQEVNLFFK